MRLASKTQLAAGRVVAVEQDIRTVSAFLSGTLTDGAEFGWLRIQGRDHELVGLRVEFQTPGSARAMQARFHVVSADNTVNVTSGSNSLTVLGQQPGGELLLASPFPLPVSSLWKVVTEVTEDDPLALQLPQNISLQWLIRPSLGPVHSRQWGTNRPLDGSSAWRVGTITEGL